MTLQAVQAIAPLVNWLIFYFLYNHRLAQGSGGTLGLDSRHHNKVDRKPSPIPTIRHLLRYALAYANVDSGRIVGGSAAVPI